MLLLLLAFKPATSHAYCFSEAGDLTGIDPLLLIAVAQQESGLETKAVNLRIRKKVDSILRKHGISFKRSTVYRKGKKRRFRYYMYTIKFKNYRQFRVLKRLMKRAVGYDVGLMQINDYHIRLLKRYGLDEWDLVQEPCLNVVIGATILKSCMAIFKNDLKRSLECYNRGTKARRVRTYPYAKRVLKIYRALKRSEIAEFFEEKDRRKRML